MSLKKFIEVGVGGESWCPASGHGICSVSMLAVLARGWGGLVGGPEKWDQFKGLNSESSESTLKSSRSRSDSGVGTRHCWQHRDSGAEGFFEGDAETVRALFFCK